MIYSLWIGVILPTVDVDIELSKIVGLTTDKNAISTVDMFYLTHHG